MQVQPPLFFNDHFLSKVEYLSYLFIYLSIYLSIYLIDSLSYVQHYTHRNKNMLYVSN
jgi:hypothetical protein